VVEAAVHRSSSVLAALALALAGCAQDPTGVAPATRTPSLPLGAPLNRPSFSHIDFANGRWTVTTVLPWEASSVGAATAINNAGVVVGSQSGRGAYRGVLGGAVTPLAGGGRPSAVNEGGDAAGFASGPAGAEAVLWLASGERVSLSARAGAGPGYAFDVNDALHVVGEASNRAVLWRPDGAVVEVAALPGATSSRATAVNNRGTVVGYVYGAGGSGSRAFVWTADGGTQLLATPAGRSSAALGINDAGQIVGWVNVTGGGPEAVHWPTPAAFAVLPNGGMYAETATSINAEGVIVGGDLRNALVWPSPTAAPIVVARAACPTAGSEQVCRAVRSSSPGAVNDRGQIAGSIYQEYYDGRHVETENGVVWSFNPNSPTPTTTTLVAQHAGRCLDVPARSRDWGTQLILWDCHGLEHQQFTYPALGQTGEIRVYGGALCIDAASGQGNNGDPIIIWGCHGGANQQWTRLSTGELRGINGRCLDVSGGATGNAAPLILWDCHGGGNQRFAPGNGASMVASAARLSPARAPLIVSGP
jgi:uncharacterized membrane protein